MYWHKNDVYFSKIGSRDLDTLYILKQESWFGTHTIPVINQEDQQKWFNSTKAIVLKAQDSDGNWFGIFKIDGINHENRICDVGWDVLANSRGQGYGKKLVQAGVDFCFEIFNMHRLNAEILENNLASQKCALAASFQKEGSKRQAIYKCGEYLDSYLYGILENEWIASRAQRYGGSVCNKTYQPKNELRTSDTA